MTDWVVNASPVISLARAGYLSVLSATADAVRVPEAVRAELLAGPEADPARRAVESGWGEALAVTPAEAVLEWGLGQGETSVISAALSRPGWTAVLDDAEARACARSLGVRVVGTLGVALRATRTGHLQAAAPVVRALRAAGLYVADDVVARALAEALGEEWSPGSG